MKKALSTLVLGALLVCGTALAGCACPSKCCDGNPPCGKCAEMKGKSCPDCKAAGGMCDHCKSMAK